MSPPGRTLSLSRVLTLQSPISDSWKIVPPMVNRPNFARKISRRDFLSKLSQMLVRICFFFAFAFFFWGEVLIVLTGFINLCKIFLNFARVPPPPPPPPPPHPLLASSGKWLKSSPLRRQVVFSFLPLERPCLFSITEEVVKALLPRLLGDRAQGNQREDITSRRCR